MKKDIQTKRKDKRIRAIYRTQVLMAVAVFLTEIIGNLLLYLTRSQGYGPDTILVKLFRYLFLTTLFNFGTVVVSRIIVRFSKSERVHKFVLNLSITLICANVAFSHYQFGCTMLIFVLPLTICVLYEDSLLSIVTLIVSMLGLSVAVFERATDPLYNTDIGPEAAISYAVTISVFLIVRIILNTLILRRYELSEAMVEVEKANASAEKAKFSLKMLETLARAIDAKDKYTNGHSFRVAIYATILAEALGWDEDRVEMLKYEAILHDIGKIGVPDSVLNKPSKLSDSEFTIIKSHTLVGADILKAMIAVPNAYLVARYHHERFDGKGYPRALSGKDIPINARIVCIADSYDAMSSDRIYRKALSEDVIRAELIKGRGAQFDPELLDVFLKLFDEHKLVIKNSAVSLENENDEQENLLEDIEKVIRHTAELEIQNNAYNDFDKFYKYMRNIGDRYNHSLEVISITVSKKEGSLVDVTNGTADSLEVAIRKNIRSVDMYYRHSARRHIVILLDAGRENIDIITQRITYDFALSDSFALKFDLNENIGTFEDLDN